MSGIQILAVDAVTSLQMVPCSVEEGRGPLAGLVGASAPASGDRQIHPLVHGDDEDDEARFATARDDDADEHDEGGELLEGLHKVFVYLTLGLVGVHVLGVLASSLAHAENLVRAMITGRKRADDTKE